MFFLHLGSGLLIITSTTSLARPSVQNPQSSQSVRLKILDRLDVLLTTLVVTNGILIHKNNPKNKKVGIQYPVDENCVAL